MFWMLALLASLGGLPLLLAGCGGNSEPGTAQSGVAARVVATANRQTGLADPTPRLDSSFVIAAIQADARYRTQERLARKFYRDRQYRLAWFRGHALVPQATTLLGTMAKADEDGLDPRRYAVPALQARLRELPAAAADTARRNELERATDVALTSTFFVWASDYYRGVANPYDKKSTVWRVKRNKIKLDHVLETVLGERTSSYAAYADFAPLHPQYGYLKKALAELRAQQAAGGWPRLPATTSLKPGAVDGPVVALLRQRLRTVVPQQPADTLVAKPVIQTSASSPVSPATDAYDLALVAAVKGFQRDLGLQPTGIVSGQTLRALNVPLADRIRQTILNLERWRWLPKKFEPDYLLVNIPEFRLRAFRKGQQALTMRVIVGKALTATPVFSDKLEYVVLAPYWNVPFSIIAKELRPLLIANPRACLARLDMEVVRGSGSSATVVNPASVNWAAATPDNFRYTLRRRPGPKNDLGDVKFIFPNSDDVYLHDTPHDQLFAESRRDFSHGCVRVEEPIRLATHLLRDTPGWDEKAIRASIAKRQEQYITVRQKLPVYLVYFTAWADADGHPHFREDIYGHDRALAQTYF